MPKSRDHSDARTAALYKQGTDEITYAVKNRQTVAISETRFITPLKCPRCSHFWNYAGKNDYFASCPHCKTTVSIGKHTVLQTDQRLAPSNQSAASVGRIAKESDVGHDK